ncbi:MAG TPA: hypothetical protein VFK05_00160 [Polyangiaceae bacterium]|nr:hypothetical protein [Polyangiaceae bacterium]
MRFSQSIGQSFRCRAGSVFGAALLSLFVRVQPAHAEDSASDRATARELAGEGYAALQRKDYATAEERFRRADALVHAPTLVLDQARALVGLGRFGEAYAAFDSVIRETLPPSAPPVWKRAVKEATVEIEAIKPKIGWLTVQVKGASEPRVEIDGRALPPSDLGQRLPETAGELHIVVSATGYVTRSVDQRLLEGEDKQLEIALLPVTKPPPEVVILPPPRPEHVDHTVDERRKERRTLAYVSFAVSGVGVALGATTGVLWLNARSDIKAACGGLDCQPQNATEQARLESDKQRYDTFGTLSVIGFGVGLAGAATGAALLLSQPSESPPAARSSAVRAYVGPGMLGIRGVFQ